jgi:STAM-binding protein
MTTRKPRSTAELNRQASIQVDSNINITLYFRSADHLLKQARVYFLEDDLEHAYVLYMKYLK